MALYHSFEYQTSFESTGLSVQKFWQLWQPSWISDWNNFSYFDIQIQILPTYFPVKWPFGSGEVPKICKIEAILIEMA